MKRIALILVLTMLMQMAIGRWWAVFFFPFIVEFLLGKHAFKSFLIAGCATGLLWLVYAHYLWLGPADLIAGRIGNMMQTESYVLIVLTGLVAFLAGGFAGMTGKVLRSAMLAPK